MAHPGWCPSANGAAEPPHSGQAPYDFVGLRPPHWCFASNRLSSAFKARSRANSRSLVSLLSLDRAARGAPTDGCAAGCANAGSRAMTHLFAKLVQTQSSASPARPASGGHLTISGKTPEGHASRSCPAPVDCCNGLNAEASRTPRGRVKAGVCHPDPEVAQFARRGTAVTDRGRRPLAYAPPASGSEFAPSARLWVARKASANLEVDEAPAPRSPPATARYPTILRWFRASAAGRPDDESGRRRRQGWRSDAWQCTRAAPAIGAIEASPKEASVPSGSDASCLGEAIVSRDTRIHAGEQVQHSRPSSTAGWRRLTPLGLPVGTAVRRASPPAGWWR